jgi:L-arabonate dehydrase
MARLCCMFRRRPRLGGPLALVRSGDMITLNVAKRSVQLELVESTLATRRAQWTAPPLPARGWVRLYIERVLQADKGADLDFLVGHSGSAVARDSH